MQNTSDWIVFLFDKRHEEKYPKLGRSIAFKRECFQLRRVQCIRNPNQNNEWPWPCFWLSMWEDTTDKSWWGFVLGKPSMKELQDDTKSDGGATTPGDAPVVGGWLEKFHESVKCLKAYQWRNGVMALAETHEASVQNEAEQQMAEPGTKAPEQTITKPEEPKLPDYKGAPVKPVKKAPQGPDIS